MMSKNAFKIMSKTLKNYNSNFGLNYFGRKQVEEFLNVVGIIFPIKHRNCADNQNDSGLLAESSFQ